MKCLQQIEASQTVLMDRWNLRVDPNPDTPEKGDAVPLNIMNNYFSIGVVRIRAVNEIREFLRFPSVVLSHRTWTAWNF